MSEIRNRKVLITGAASGMGLEMARQFADEGAHILMVDVNEEGLAKAVEQVRGKAVTFRCDLSKLDQIRSLKEQVAKEVGSIDILVNNAGVVTGGTFEDVPDAKDKLMLDVDVASVLWMTKVFLPDLKAKRAGHVVNMASAAGMVPVPKMVTYCASKSFVIGFSEALRSELDDQGLDGVKVTIVCPSYVDTGMFAGVRAPMLTPILKPSFVVHRIIQAVKDDELWVREPFIVKTTPVLKALLPKRVFDRVSHTLGVTRSMHSWTGRGN